MWSVDRSSKPGILQISLEGVIAEAEMREFVAAHNAAIDALDGKPYRVFCDIRALLPLSPEAATTMEQAKNHSARHANFQGSAVLVASKLIAMQHQRTSLASGVMSTELISEDATACWAHLAHVKRG